MKLSGKTYDLLKNTAQIYLPALGTLYFALAQIWHFPAAEQVTGTVMAVDTFLGIILGISSATFNAGGNRFDGNLVSIPQESGGKTYSLEMNSNLDTLDQKSEVILKVVKPAE
jgi:Putative phage holin Dp-1